MASNNNIMFAESEADKEEFSDSLLELLQSDSNSDLDPGIQAAIGAAVLDQVTVTNDKIEKDIQFINIAENVYETQFPEIPGASDEKSIKKEKDRRRVSKDVFGGSNPDCLIVDSKSVAGKKEYCDSIMLCKDSILLWENAITEYYRKKQFDISDHKPVSGGYRILVSESDSPFLTFTFYSRKNKIMVQPGKKDEQNLKKWIHDFGDIKPEVREITIPKEHNLHDESENDWFDVEESPTDYVRKNRSMLNKSVKKSHSTPKRKSGQMKNNSSIASINSNVIKTLECEVLNNSEKLATLEQQNANKDKEIKSLESEMEKCNQKLDSLNNTIIFLKEENGRLRDMIQSQNNRDKEVSYSEKLKREEIAISVDVLHTNFANLDSKVQQWEKKINKCVQSVDAHNKCSSLGEKLNNKIESIRSDTESKYEKLEEANTAAHESQLTSIEIINHKLKCLEDSLQQFQSTKVNPVLNLESPLTSNSDTRFTKGKEKRDRDNVFQAYFARVNNYKEVKECVEKIKSSQEVAPDHNIYAFRTDKDGAGMVHDGESGAEVRLAHMLRQNDCQNCLILVARYVNGVHIGGDRFKNILEVAKDTLSEQGLLKEMNKTSQDYKLKSSHFPQNNQAKSSSERNTLWLHDSLYNKINKRNIVDNDIVSKKFTPTMQKATDVLKHPRDNKTRLIISVGSNDLRLDEAEISRNTDSMIEAALKSYTSADIHICAIPPNTKCHMPKIQSVNSAIKAKCDQNPRLHFIDTFSDLFEYNSKDVTTDGVHLNQEGVKIVQHSINVHFKFPPLSSSIRRKPLNPHAPVYHQPKSPKVPESHNSNRYNYVAPILQDQPVNCIPGYNNMGYFHQSYQSQYPSNNLMHQYPNTYVPWVPGFAGQ